MTYFPLFRLPLLAFQHAIDQFEITELLFMSLCSKRTLILLRNHLNKAVKIDVASGVGSSDLSLSLRKAGQNENVYFCVNETFKARPLSLESCIEKSNSNFVNGTCFYLHWNDWFDGLKAITNHVIDLFGGSIHGISFRDAKYPDRVKKLTNYVMSLQNTIEDLSYILRETSDEDISHILNGIIPTDTLWLCHDDGKEHRLNFPSYNLQRASIIGNVKLTLDQLKSFNCQRFQANGPVMSMKEMNGFLKHWINGGSSRIERFTIETEPSDLTVLFDGIEMVERDNEVVRMYIYPSNQQTAVNGGFDITRNDGKIATIRKPINELFISFEMFVWN